MKQNIYLIIGILLISIAYAGNVGFNVSVQGNMKYDSVVDTPDQYNEVHVIAEDSRVDMSYWLDYENPEISISQYPSYYVTEVKQSSADRDKIMRVVGEGFNDYIDSLGMMYPSKIELWYNSTIKTFNNFILSQVHNIFFQPLARENEFLKRKISYIENDLNELIELMHQPEHDSYDCLALKSMMKDGLVERGDCSGSEWIADEKFIVSFQES